MRIFSRTIWDTKPLVNLQIALAQLDRVILLTFESFTCPYLSQIALEIT